MPKQLLVLLICFLLGFTFSHLSAQEAKHLGNPSRAPEDRAIGLADAGRCREAIPLLKPAIVRPAAKDVKRKVGLSALRCAMTLDDRDLALEALRMLNREFPSDPDVLYVSTHAYSDLSTRASETLARTAPLSEQAHELNAEALEVQGRWDDAAKEYRAILDRKPRLPGIHYRLGRVLLSKPNLGPDGVSEAKKEFQLELEIDPNNAGAEYVLGEMARHDGSLDDAVTHFSRATKLDAGFGDAFLGLGESLIATKKFEDAVPPLETAVKLEPANPATHYNLATAYSRTGKKAEADKEFAIHRQMTQKEPPPEDKAQQNPN